MEDIQERIKKFCKDNDMESPPEHRVLDTMSELGEVAKEVLKMSDYGKKTPEYREEVKSEMGDALFALITLANSLDISLEEALNEVIEKYEKRLSKGSAGSEND